MDLPIAIFLVVLLVFVLTALFGAPYVPSSNKEVKKAFKNLYSLGRKDLLIDLGSGDGKVLKTAHEFGAKGIGIEVNPLLVWISKFRLRKFKDTQVLCRDFYRYNFPAETTVVYVFGDGRDMSRIVRYIERQTTKLDHPIYLVSHAFEAEGHKLIKQYRAYFLYKISPEKKEKK